MNLAILHGGASNNDFLFYREVVRGLYKFKLHVLIIPNAMYSSHECDNDKYFCKSMISGLSWVNMHKQFTASILNMDAKYGIRQIKDADIIYTPGGNGDMLRDSLIDAFGIDLLLEAFTKFNGNYYGVSAGGNLLSRYYYSNDNQEINQGLGLLDIATFCHYETGKYTKLNKLITEVGDMVKMVIPITNNGFVSLEASNYYAS